MEIPKTKLKSIMKYFIEKKEENSKSLEKLKKSIILTNISYMTMNKNKSTYNM